MPRPAFDVAPGPDPRPVSAPREDRRRAMGALVGYLDDLMGRKTAVPGDDLLSGLFGRVENGEPTRMEAARIGMLPLIAGHETTANMIAFGFGVHQCLGRPLARIELQVVYSTLYRRLPNLALACRMDEIPFKHDASVYGVYELPVTW